MCNIFMKTFTSNNQKTGEIGENVACKYLENKGFYVLERNYTKKWGEIDVIAKKNNKLYFIEVKSRITHLSDDLAGNYELGVCRPEEGMHALKMKRLSKVIQTYLMSNKIGDVEWQVDLYSVFLDIDKKTAKIKVIENIIL